MSDRSVEVDFQPPVRGSELRLNEVIPGNSAKRDYLFVNNVRFLSMAAVVAIHCVLLVSRIAGSATLTLPVCAVLQCLKFGTIGFFLISGFLMGEGLCHKKPSEYMARRIRTVFLPWLFWFSMYCCLVMRGSLPGLFDANSFGNVVVSLMNMFRERMFESIYWFVPNLMISLSILLVCRRFLDDLRFGCVLFVVSLLYGVNIYTQWVAVSSHTEALFGFVFYLWLGVWAGRNFARVEDWLKKMPLSVVAAAIALSWIAALAESSLQCFSPPSPRWVRLPRQSST